MKSIVFTGCLFQNAARIYNKMWFSTI